jgi:hypothetical protein
MVHAPLNLPILSHTSRPPTREEMPSVDRKKYLLARRDFLPARRY